MKRTKPLLLLISLLITLVILVPSLLVLPFHAKTKEAPAAAPASPAAKPATAAAASAVQVAVLRSKSNKVEKLPLERYVAGVISAEMPADFELEALKAQALTARTYVLKKMVLGAANVTDTVSDQVYKSEEELQKLWGKDYDWKMKRIQEAVQATAGQVLSYKGELITASFFSTSNGYTENSEDYWGNAYPYLRSVNSPWDTNAPKFQVEQQFSVADFQQKLGVKIVPGTVGSITERTPANRVKTVAFSDKKLSGRDVREKLGLRSTDFSWKLSGDKVIVTTKGYGHGVGMSQYGANGMAKEGKSYKDIVTHYYQGIEIASVTQYEQKLTAKK